MKDDELSPEQEKFINIHPEKLAPVERLCVDMLFALPRMPKTANRPWTEMEPLMKEFFEEEMVENCVLWVRNRVKR